MTLIHTKRQAGTWSISGDIGQNSTGNWTIVGTPNVWLKIKQLQNGVTQVLVFVPIYQGKPFWYICSSHAQNEKPPGIGPQVLVHVATYLGKPIWGYLFF